VLWISRPAFAVFANLLGHAIYWLWLDGLPTADHLGNLLSGLSLSVAIVPVFICRAGIWELTKDGVFYGHYHEPQPAFDAANAAARAIVANGGSADILLRGERPRR
jgi:hypothetical protein